MYEPPVGEAPKHVINLTIQAGSRLCLTGQRDVAPDLDAAAVRVEWADPASSDDGEPVVSGMTDWTGARVSEGWAAR